MLITRVKIKTSGLFYKSKAAPLGDMFVTSILIFTDTESPDLSDASSDSALDEPPEQCVLYIQTRGDLVLLLVLQDDVTLDRQHVYSLVRHYCVIHSLCPCVFSLTGIILEILC